MSADTTDTIVALSSGRPPAAVAIVRTSGPAAFEAAEKLCGRLPEPRRASLRRLVDDGGGLIDEALVMRFDSPNSATGENIVEYQCHGGRATVDALIRALLSIPAIRLAQPGEFTRRALANGRIDLTEAEGLADLLAAETELQRRSAMARADGVLRRRLDGWRDQLLQLSARAELAIDYADDEEAGSDPGLRPALDGLAKEMRLLVDRPRVEPLRDGIRVVVAGPPNAGKSSLVNALVREERAIVTPIPGTTRDVIEISLAIDGVPFVLVDTAGIRQSGDEVESIGIDRARREMERADILLWLGPPNQAPARPAVLRIGSKSDIVQTPGVELSVSAKTGDSLHDLAALLAKTAVGLIPQGDELALDRRQHDLLGQAHAALLRASELSDSVLVAEELRIARMAIDQITGRAGVEDLLDALFSRFCLGK